MNNHKQPGTIYFCGLALELREGLTVTGNAKKRRQPSTTDDGKTRHFRTTIANEVKRLENRT